MKAILLILFTLISCGKEAPWISEYYKECPYPMEQNGKIFIIGDSISLGYTPFIEDYYAQKVVHNPCNGKSSKWGKSHIDSWLEGQDFNICTLNHGMWDMLREGPASTSFEEYKENLDYEISSLKNKCDKVLLVNTTRVPENVYYIKDESVLRNNVMQELATEHGLVLCDLYSISETITHLHDSPDEQNDVHFQVEGSEILADELISCINSL